MRLAASIFKMRRLFLKVEEVGYIGQAIEVAQPFYDDLLSWKLSLRVYLIAVCVKV